MSILQQYRDAIAAIHAAGLPAYDRDEYEPDGAPLGPHAVLDLLPTSLGTNWQDDAGLRIQVTVYASSRAPAIAALEAGGTAHEALRALSWRALDLRGITSMDPTRSAAARDYERN